ncbi:hypothetical protein DFJ73DRAFT_833897 [Zopfochytrium polystomum]|nr:hypothetical protein DFJ73DRAFT_833897 [Zopfochytrium polystomum]
MQRHPPPRFPGLSLTLVDQSHVLRGPTTSSTTSPTTASTPSLFSSSATLSPSSSSPLDSPQSGIHRHPPPYGDSQWVSRQFSPPSSSPELSPVAMGRSISLPSRISSRSPPPPFSEKTKPPPLLFSPPSPEQLKAPEFPEKSCSLGAVGDGTRGALIPAENVSPLRTHLMWNMFYWSPDLWNSLLPPPKRDANGRMNFLPRSSSRDPRNIGVRPTPVLETITHSWNVFQTGILTFGRSTEADLRAIKAARRVKFRSADDVWRLPPSQPSSSDDSADGTTERKGPKPPKIVIPGPQIRMLSSPVDEEEDEDMPLRHGQMLSTFLATHGREFPGVSFYSSQQAEAPATAPTAPSGGTASRSPSATRSPRQPRPPLNRPAPVRAGSIYIPKDALGPAAVNAFTGPSVPAGNAASISPGAAAVFSMFSQSNLLLDARTGRSPTSNFAAMSVSPTAASGRDPVVDTGSTNSSASPRLLVPNGPTFDDVMEAAQFWSSRPAEQSPVDVLMRRASPTSPSVGPFSPIISPASARAGR